MSSSEKSVADEKEALKADVQKDPRELEREADRARADVSHTLDALERRLSPGELLDQGLKMLRGSGDGTGFVSNLATQVRNNPVPTLLTGIGLTWLMAASDRPPRYQGTTSRAASSEAGSGISGMGEKASDAASAALGAASQTADKARSGAQRGRAVAEDAADRAHDFGRSVADASRTGAHRAREGYDYLRHEQPLVLGALAVAAGALIGGLLPGTETEDRYIGEYSDDTTARLKEEADHTAERAKKTAASAAESAAREARPPASSGSGTSGQMPGSTSGALP
jgi:hypothetical protein